MKQANRYFYTSLFSASILLLHACSNKTEKPAINHANVSAPALTFIGSVNLPKAYRFKNTEVGGLSGLDYDSENDAFYAISDDRGAVNYPRFYSLKINIADGELSDGDITFTSVAEILDTRGNAYQEGGLDPEAIRFDSNSNSLYWTSEGDPSRGIAPTLMSMTTGGQFIEELPLPSAFTPKQHAGIRDNKSLESLALSLDKKSIFTATETALHQDGPEEGFSQGSQARVAEIDIATKTIVSEYIYPTDPIAEKPLLWGLFATNGLVELLAIGKQHFIAIERSFTLSKGNTIKLYLTSTKSATNILGLFSLTDSQTPVKVMPKQLLLDLDMLNIPLDNIEGLSFGPVLPNGDATLVLVSDNNFNSSGQNTQFIAFRFKPHEALNLYPLETSKQTEAAKTLGE